MASSTNAATIGAHNSGLTAWAKLNIAGTSIQFSIKEIPKMLLDSSGNLNVYGTVTATSFLGNATSANYAYYFPTAYAGGQQLNPQTYFNQGIGLKVAMTAAAGV